MKRKECRPRAAVVLVLAPLPVLADSSLELESDLRARHEQVDDSGFEMKAQASTVRLRAARAAFGPGFSALVEGEGPTLKLDALLEGLDNVQYTVR